MVGIVLGIWNQILFVYILSRANQIESKPALSKVMNASFSSSFHRFVLLDASISVKLIRLEIFKQVIVVLCFVSMMMLEIYFVFFGIMYHVSLFYYYVVSNIGTVTE